MTQTSVRVKLRTFFFFFLHWRHNENDGSLEDSPIFYFRGVFLGVCTLPMNSSLLRPDNQLGISSVVQEGVFFLTLFGTAVPISGTIH